MENRTNSISWDTSGLSGKPIKNLVFDLGGVILDLSVPDTLHSFARVSGIDLPQVKKLFVESEGFLQYEKGEIGDDEFRDFVRRLYAIEASDEELDRCWNAMLLGIPVQKLDLLLQLKEKYSVYLLSNTNTIHLDYIEQKILPATGSPHAGFAGTGAVLPPRLLFAPYGQAQAGRGDLRAGARGKQPPSGKYVIS